MKRFHLTKSCAHLLLAGCALLTTAAFGKTALYTEFIIQDGASQPAYYGEVGLGESKGIVYTLVPTPGVSNAYNFKSPGFPYNGRPIFQYALSKSMSTPRSPLDMYLSQSYRRICATNDQVRYLYAGNQSTVSLESPYAPTQLLLDSFVVANNLDSEKPKAAAVFRQDWKVDWEFNLTYDLNGGEGPFAATTFTNEMVVPEAVPVRIGYTFKEWRDRENGSTYQTNALLRLVNGSKEKDVGSRDPALEAQWTAHRYTIVLDANDDSDRTVELAATYDAPVTLTTSSFARDGFKIEGWALAADGPLAYTNGVSVTNLAGAEKDNDRIRLFAVWKARSYTLALNPNGGTVSPTSVSVTYGGSYPPLPMPVRANVQADGWDTAYAFLGWKPSSSFGDYFVTTGTVYDNVNIRDLFAYWSESRTGLVYQVAFDAAGGTVVPETADFQHGGKYSGLPVAERTGYSFVNWLCDGDVVRDGETVELVSNVTFVAAHTANVYRVTLDANGGEGGQPFADAVYDAALPSVTNAPTLAGHLFGGFFDGPSDAAVCYYDADLTARFETWTQPSNVTLIAHWAVDPVFDLALDPGEKGSVEPASLVATNGEPLVTLPTPTSASPSVTFAGWWTGEGGTGEQRRTGDLASLEETTLYARWKGSSEEAQVVVKIGYGRQNGSTVTIGGQTFLPDFSVARGTTASALPVPVSDNPEYAFAWYEMNGRALRPDDTLTDDIAVLTARWTLAKYNELLGVSKAEIAFDRNYPKTSGVADWEEASDPTYWRPESATLRSGSAARTEDSSNLSLCFARAGTLVASYAVLGGNYDELSFKLNEGAYRTSMTGSPDLSWQTTTNVFAALDELQHSYYKGSKAGLALAAFVWQPSAPETGIDPWARAEVRTNVVFETGGTAAWTLAVGEDPSAGIVSQPVDDRGYAWVRGTVQGRGVLTFDWRVSCEGGYTDAAGAFVPCDFVELTDETGVRLAFLDGVTNASPVAVTVTNRTAGTHVYTWCYRKDAAGAAGDDRAWLNAVTWTPLAGGDEPTERDAPTVSAVGLADGVFSLSFAADARFDYVLEATPTLAPPEWTDVDGPKSVGTDGPLVFMPPVAADEPQMFYRVRVQAK